MNGSLTPALVVLMKIGAMFLVMLVGWAARRRAWLTAGTTSGLSRFVVDVTFPALAFEQMLRTVTPAALRAEWFIPVWVAAIMLVSWLVGLAARLAADRVGPGSIALRGVPGSPMLRGAQRATIVFLVAVPNWIYLPLPIVQALYGAAGVRTVLLGNVGVQLLLWSLGPWSLGQRVSGRETFRHLATNPGLVATLLGVGLALAVPAARGLETADIAVASLPVLGAAVVVQALAMVGNLTIPLSLLVTGAQLGELPWSDHRPSRALTAVLVARLVLAPLAVIGLTVLATQWRLVALPEVARLTGYIIAAMPVAVSCGVFAERFGGDTSLAARAIFYSTLASLITVPLVVTLVQRFGW